MPNFCKTELLNFGRSLTERPDPASFERHCHIKYELLYVVSGRGKCIVEGKEYPLSDGAVFIFRPLEYHCVCPDPNSVYERYVCNFAESILMDAVRALPILSAKSQGLYFFGYSTGDNFCNVIENLVDYFEKNDPNGAQGEAMAIAAINQLLLLLSHTKEKQVESAGNELINGIIEYLNRNLDKKLSLDETAKRFFISKYYLCRLFRKHTGVSVLAYLNSKRIVMAQHLISSGEPPTAVAYAVGFRDYSSFYRAYVKEIGKPPSFMSNKAVVR